MRLLGAKIFAGPLKIGGRGCEFMIKNERAVDVQLGSTIKIHGEEFIVYAVHSRIEINDEQMAALNNPLSPDVKPYR